MNIDVFILGNISRDLIDVISLSIRGALLNTQICRVTPVYNQLQGTYEMELKRDKANQTFTLDVTSTPLLITIGEHEGSQVIDLS